MTTEYVEATAYDEAVLELESALKRIIDLEAHTSRGFHRWPPLPQEPRIETKIYEREIHENPIQ